MCCPMISVIIPMYNVSSSIQRCLNSILGSGVYNIELLCVDDGSSDNTVHIVEKIASKDSRVRLFENSHMGVSTARNTGLKHAKGKYIAFVDSDDALTEGAIEQIEYILSNQQCDCLTFGGYTEGKSQRAKSIAQTLLLPDVSFCDKDVLERALYEIPCCNLFIWNKIFRNDIIQTNNIKFDTEISLGEDRAFIFDYFVHVNKVISISKKLYIYTADHESSITNSYARFPYKKACSHLDVVEHILENWSAISWIDLSAQTIMLNWASSYVYRPQKDFYTDEERDEILKKLLNLVQKYYPNISIEIHADTIKFKT